MKKYIVYIILIYGIFSQSACLQSSDKAEPCYSDKLSDNEKVVMKMVNKPHFKGGNDSLSNFLSDNLNFEQIINDMSQNEKPYNDKARIKFIVNRQGGISNLSVKMTKDKQFTDEVTRVIKKSSCNWVAGGTNQPVNGWHHFDLYYSIEKPSDNELKTVMTINEL